MPLPTVIVIDPEPRIQARLATALTAAGYEAVGWRSSQGAHALIGREQPVLVLINDWLERPRVGWRLLEELHWDPATTAIPVVIATETQAAVNASLRQLAFAVLAEPLDLAEILRLVDQAGQRPDRRRRLPEMAPEPEDRVDYQNG